ncbi:MAG: Cytoplasmic peptidoglycan synthetase, N-terminal:ATP-dependent carboxylate-amine ligase-like [Candidatus Saccharibacteria bacterium]|nr:Cytoplasmic peptidoglycan synthetase, N-terminal:ATP-dependent carboxylate-amine ligase-like [Candidatus Saccharibacteria bacterium]
MRITATLVYKDLTARGIDVQHVSLGKNSFFIYTYRDKLRTMCGVSTDLSSFTSKIICDNKGITMTIADKLGIKIPATAVYTNDEAASDFIRKYGTIVVKPVDGAHGNGVTINVTTVELLDEAISRARRNSASGGIILQQQVTGSDFRLLVIGGEVVAVSERVAASVMGDGVHTYKELIGIENDRNVKRGENYEKALNYIDVEAAQLFLADRINDIPDEGEVAVVVGTANMGTGGTAINRTGEMPSAMIAQAEQIVKEIGAFSCGVDFMYEKDSDEWFLIELNGSPSFGLHHLPSEGESVNVTKIFVDKLLNAYDQEALTINSESDTI